MVPRMTTWYHMGTSLIGFMDYYCNCGSETEIDCDNTCSLNNSGQFLPFCNVRIMW